MLRLRTKNGIHESEYERKYLMPFAPLDRLMKKFAEKGLAESKNGGWVLTEEGWLLSNRIILTLHEAQERSTPLAKKR